jgi:hypothetical protein
MPSFWRELSMDPENPTRFRCLRCKAEQERLRYPDECFVCGYRDFAIVSSERSTPFGVQRDHMGRPTSPYPRSNINADGEPVVDPEGTELLPEEVIKFRRMAPMLASYPQERVGDKIVRPFDLADPPRAHNKLAGVRYDCIDAVEAGIETAEWWANREEDWQND